MNTSVCVCVCSSNILLDEHWGAKLADFGLARFAPRGLRSGNTASQTVSVAKTTTIRGTQAYLPKEYVTGGKLGPAVDVYSFGVVRYPRTLKGNCWLGRGEEQCSAFFEGGGSADVTQSSYLCLFQVLLEILTGRRALERGGKAGERYLVSTFTHRVWFSCLCACGLCDAVPFMVVVLTVVV